MKNSPVKTTTKPVTIIEVPLLVDNLECEILVRSSSRKPNDAKFRTLRRLEDICGSLGGIQQIRIKDLIKNVSHTLNKNNIQLFGTYIELVAHDVLGRRIVTILNQKSKNNEKCKHAKFSEWRPFVVNNLM
jgi:hypothetical protein